MTRTNLKKLLPFLLGLGLALLTVLPALADSSSQQQSELDPAGPAAQHIRDLWVIITIPAMIVLVGVGGMIIYAAFRFKERDPNFVPKQIGGNNALELTWTLIPAVILFALFGVSAPQMFYLRHSPSPDGMHVKVVGHRFAWEFQYTGIKKPQFHDLYIPVGTAVNLDLHSADVIHSFSVPRLAGRLDAIPGQVNTLWIQADSVGDYYGQCTELCGTGHADMTVVVHALSKSDWDAWYAKQQGGH